MEKKGPGKSYVIFTILAFLFGASFLNVYPLESKNNLHLLKLRP